MPPPRTTSDEPPGPGGQAFTKAQLLSGVLAVLQILTLAWVFDMGSRMRAVESRQDRQEASLKAVEPFVMAERGTLTALATTMTRQEVLLQQTDKTVTELNAAMLTMAQEQLKMSKGHVELRASLERIEQRMAPAARR